MFLIVLLVFFVEMFYTLSNCYLDNSVENEVSGLNKAFSFFPFLKSIRISKVPGFYGNVVDT